MFMAATWTSSISRIAATLPALLLMFVGQRFIIAGLTLGSVK
jgi:ABC-type glycerol-3-phosphate transport system permease component